MAGKLPCRGLRPEHQSDVCRGAEKASWGAMLLKAGSVYFPEKPWKKPNQGPPDTAASAAADRRSATPLPV